MLLNDMSWMRIRKIEGNEIDVLLYTQSPASDNTYITLQYQIAPGQTLKFTLRLHQRQYHLYNIIYVILCSSHEIIFWSNKSLGSNDYKFFFYFSLLLFFLSPHQMDFLYGVKLTLTRRPWRLRSHRTPSKCQSWHGKVAWWVSWRMGMLWGAFPSPLEKRTRLLNQATSCFKVSLLLSLFTSSPWYFNCCSFTTFLTSSQKGWLQFLQANKSSHDNDGKYTGKKGGTKTSS